MSRIWLFLSVGALTGFILLPAQGATDEQLEQFKAQINAEIGVMDNHLCEAEVCQALVRHAHRVILAADQTKFSAQGLVVACKFEDIDLRTTAAVGATWRPIHTDDQTLRFWLGLGYRHESFDNGVEDDSSATLDSGVAHHWMLKPWLTLDNSLAYAPALDDFGSYLLTHDTALAMPVGASRWILRIGVHDDYNSDERYGIERTDTE